MLSYRHKPFVFGTLTSNYALCDSRNQRIHCDWPVELKELMPCIGRMMRVRGNIECDQSHKPINITRITEIGVYINMPALGGLWKARRGFYPQWRIWYLDE